MADEVEAGNSPPGSAPRPLTYHFPLNEAQAAPGSNSDDSRSCELMRALVKRKARSEVGATTFESVPTESTADAASHLEGLTFNAPPATEWLGQFAMPLEDRTAEYLAEELEARAPVPEHAPRAFSTEEVSRIQSLAKAVADMQQTLHKERDSLSGQKEELARRAAEVRTKELALEEEYERQRRLEEAARNYPRPDWLQRAEGTMNIGIVGNAGVGKSLLINRLRGVQPKQEGWAEVGVIETTDVVSMYAFPGERRVRLWDFPGAGTERFPLDDYIARMGLRYLDKVLITTAGRFTETEIKLREELERHGVPYLIVRTKIDVDIFNNKQVKAYPAGEIITGPEALKTQGRQRGRAA
eukprot:gnl/TRDRNA2_/TRDRNA2_128466_c0_seq2.p1 gnl/TRDRNA2_/TRDRNA2_128466_c0~~gnl/TRDRNA2_/TRDRNA2_128466_c0_seq2.p1  ORF type:complete len:356 (+),score=75.22 gnl/TRDRNA2_/TRDRNA2_128466_c0_seq2:121-1188(+)